MTWDTMVHKGKGVDGKTSFFSLRFELRSYIIRSLGFPTRSDTKRPVQSQKKVRSLKFRI